MSETASHTLTSEASMAPTRKAIIDGLAPPLPPVAEPAPSLPADE